MPQLTDQQWEDLRLQIDSLENNTVTLTLLVSSPDRVHVDVLRRSLPEIVKRMQAVVAEVDGDDDGEDD